MAASKFSFGDVPMLPRPRAPGGIASDIGGGFASFVGGMQKARDTEAEKAFRQATLELQREGLTQREAEAEAERRFRRSQTEREAELRQQLMEKEEELRRARELEVERARQKRPLTPASTAAQMSRIRSEFDQQIRAQQQARTADIKRKEFTPGIGGLLSEEDLAVIEGRTQPQLSRSDSTAALEATRRQVPETPELVGQFGRSLGLEGEGRGTVTDVDDDDVVYMSERLRKGETPASIIADARRRGADEATLTRLIRSIELAGEAVRGGR